MSEPEPPLTLALALERVQAAARAGPAAWAELGASLGLEPEPLTEASLERALALVTRRASPRPLSAIFANAARTTAPSLAPPAGLETLRCRRCGAAREHEAVSSCQYCGATPFEPERSPWTT